MQAVLQFISNHKKKTSLLCVIHTALQLYVRKQNQKAFIAHIFVSIYSITIIRQKTLSHHFHTSKCESPFARSDISRPKKELRRPAAELFSSRLPIYMLPPSRARAKCRLRRDVKRLGRRRREAIRLFPFSPPPGGERKTAWQKFYC